jgi:hydrogenase maturation protein HypF
LRRYRIRVEGVVQGVGFRPFVKRLADRMGIAGRVWNTGGGVTIEVECDDPEPFQDALEGEAPPNARIASCSVEELAPHGYHGFTILPSEVAPGAFTLISPDLATCAACLAELRDPQDRRHRYPFINCTDCGPRYTITRAVPYDRANTTMDRFALCPSCAREYADPDDRRFHAEPDACPVCGPKLSAPVEEAAAILARGGIVALKSIGGFQLACDATNRAAVVRLRSGKRRGRKPFAVMMRDLEAVARLCRCDAEAGRQLASAAAPIVLLPLADPAAFPPELTSGLGEFGVMLPYTPLHHLLFDQCGLDCLVMTSGNISEEPIVIDNREAEVKLGPLCDLVLAHDRDIFMRVDDSVVRGPSIIRRARGYAPNPIDLGVEVGDVLAVGGELKNAFCLTRGRYAVMSQHIGDLENFETLQFFEETLRNLKSVYRAEPRAIAHDLHPDYLSTRWALRQPGPHVAVQHHHAHIVSCMAVNGVRDPVIGVAWDGTGYGDDGQVWGGEFLVCDARGYERAAHLRYVPLPGGDRAAREGYRMALAHVRDALGTGAGLPFELAAPRRRILEQLCDSANTPRTSSAGRLFDAVAALCGVCLESSYEGEAAMLFETAASGSEGEPYPFAIEGDAVDTRPLIRCVLEDVRRGLGAALVSQRFHSTMAVMMESLCAAIRDRTGVNKVCLSGGTFQNSLLSRQAEQRLSRKGFDVYTHRLVPANDGGLALGQAVVAAGRI